MEKTHTKKCASEQMKWNGDQRNPHVNPNWNERKGPCNCDGYHTFDELYDHRIALWIALCKCAFQMDQVSQMVKNPAFFDVWKSKRHSDGELAFGGTWFVLGIGKEKGRQITYHLPIERWNETEFAETLDKAPEFDGHTSDDVLVRLKGL